jgi:hypothetical protein
MKRPTTLPMAMPTMAPVDSLFPPPPELSGDPDDVAVGAVVCVVAVGMRCSGGLCSSSCAQKSMYTPCS